MNLQETLRAKQVGQYVPEVMQGTQASIEMLHAAIAGIPHEMLANTLNDAMTLSGAPDEVITEASNKIGRIPGQRVRASF